eukprot:5233831-Prymnesium_polylepis.1
MSLPPITPESCVRAGRYWFKPVDGISVYVKGYNIGQRLKDATRRAMARDALSPVSKYEVHMGGYHFSPNIIWRALRTSAQELRTDENDITYMVERLDAIEAIFINVRRTPRHCMSQASRCGCRCGGHGAAHGKC